MVPGPSASLNGQRLRAVRLVAFLAVRLAGDRLVVLRAVFLAVRLAVLFLAVRFAADFLVVRFAAALLVDFLAVRLAGERFAVRLAVVDLAATCAS